MLLTMYTCVQLKFNKRNEEVAEYSKRADDEQWMFSEKTVQILKEYQNK